jgi:hypothetical protein
MQLIQEAALSLGDPLRSLVNHEPGGAVNLRELDEVDRRGSTRSIPLDASLDGLAAQILLDILLRTPALVAPRPERHVPLLVFRASALSMDEAAARAGLGVLLEALGALRVPDVVDGFLFDRE